MSGGFIGFIGGSAKTAVMTFCRFFPFPLFLFFSFISFLSPHRPYSGVVLRFFELCLSVQQFLRFSCCFCRCNSSYLIRVLSCPGDRYLLLLFGTYVYVARVTVFPF